MPQNPSNVSLIAVIFVIILVWHFVNMYMLRTINKHRKDQMRIPPNTIKRLFYSHTKYGDTLGWTVTHTWTEPKKRRKYVQRADIKTNIIPAKFD